MPAFKGRMADNILQTGQLLCHVAIQHSPAACHSIVFRQSFLSQRAADYSRKISFSYSPGSMVVASVE